jgi:hypothetical protein
MIASNNILPDPGDPGALSRLIMDYRNQKQREAVVNQGMQFDQNRNQGVLIQNQMAQAQLDEFNTSAPNRARREKAAAELVEAQTKTAAIELTKLQVDNGIFGKARRFVDGGLAAMQNMAKVAQIQQATQATQQSTDRKLHQDAFDSLINNNTGPAYEAFFHANPELASTMTGLPVPVLRVIVAQASNAREKLARESENAKNSPDGQFESGLRSAVEVGNYDQAFAMVRERLLNTPGFNAQLATAAGDRGEIERIYNAYVFTFLDARGYGDKAREYLAAKAKAGAGNPGTPTAGGTPAAATDPRIQPVPPPTDGPRRARNLTTGEDLIEIDGQWVPSNQTR